MRSFHILVHEIRVNGKWVINWVIGISLYILASIFLYPGEKGVQGILSLLEEPYFKAFLGEIGGDFPAYTLWVSMLLPFLNVVYLIFGILSGVRVASKSISDDTGELIHTLPVYRIELIAMRVLAMIILSALHFIALTFLLATPIVGVTVPLDRLLEISGWGILFIIFSLSLGIFIGMFDSDTGKGNQIGILVAISFYIFQVLSRVIDELQDVADLNPISWYSPNSILLNAGIDGENMQKIVISTLILLISSFFYFLRRDLVKGLSLTFPNPFRKKKKPTFKSDRSSFFVVWARSFEKYLPITADFVYSEKRVLTIMFYVIFMFYPLQLMFYPGDEKFIHSVEGFLDSVFLKLFTNGVDLSTEPYLLFVMSQSIGVHWMIFLPLSYHWMKKLSLRDANTGTGEITGTYPIPARRVMMERYLSILLESALFFVIMSASLALSEAVIGKSYDLYWEIIAIAMLFPVYWLIISLGALIIQTFGERGVELAKYLVLWIFVNYVIGIVTDPTIWYWQGILGMYNPSKIIIDKSITINSGASFIAIFLWIITTMFLFVKSTRIQWIKT